MRAALLIALVIGALGCDDNPCISLCQQYDRWLQDCDATWEDRFGDQGWTSVDDCYDSYQGATEEVRTQCDADADAVIERSCY